jgi:hypothetical protein
MSIWTKAKAKMTMPLDRHGSNGYLKITVDGLRYDFYIHTFLAAGGKMVQLRQLNNGSFFDIWCHSGTTVCTCGINNCIHCLAVQGLIRKKKL